eukprot:TRINITY_DN12152_c0_g1_i4.p1 TRINITY_DN12152_c0_g1~~TRINITY_DN12152_c0_g1_i4.p1  ORF type:complete len:666 (+),score=102.25 TRINITY_DN12152_c0_g1_i4:95-2092(+)
MVRSVLQWDAHEVSEWVEECLRVPYGATLRKHAVDGAAFVELDESKLRAMQIVESSHITRLLRHVEAMRSQIGLSQEGHTTACRRSPSGAHATMSSAAASSGDSYVPPTVVPEPPTVVPELKSAPELVVEAKPSNPPRQPMQKTVSDAARRSTSRGSISQAQPSSCRRQPSSNNAPESPPGQTPRRRSGVVVPSQGAFGRTRTTPTRPSGGWGRPTALADSPEQHQGLVVRRTHTSPNPPRQPQRPSVSQQLWSASSSEASSVAFPRPRKSDRALFGGQLSAADSAESPETTSFILTSAHRGANQSGGSAASTRLGEGPTMQQHLGWSYADRGRRKIEAEVAIPGVGLRAAFSSPRGRQEEYSDGVSFGAESVELAESPAPVRKAPGSMVVSQRRLEEEEAPLPDSSCYVWEDPFANDSPAPGAAGMGGAPARRRAKSMEVAVGRSASSLPCPLSPSAMSAVSTASPSSADPSPTAATSSPTDSAASSSGTRLTCASAALSAGNRTHSSEGARKSSARSRARSAGCASYSTFGVSPDRGPRIGTSPRFQALEVGPGPGSYNTTKGFSPQPTPATFARRAWNTAAANPLMEVIRRKGGDIGITYSPSGSTLSPRGGTMGGAARSCANWSWAPQRYPAPGPQSYTPRWHALAAARPSSAQQQLQSSS